MSEEVKDFETRYSLIECVRDRSDHESWKDFVGFYDQYIYNILRYYDIDSTDAEQVCLKIVQRLWEDVPKFDDEKKGQIKFRAWLGEIIIDEINTFFKKDEAKLQAINKKISESSGADNNEATFNEVIESEWAAHISNKAWETIQDCLKDNAKKIFLMSINGHSLDQIAEECGVSKDSICVFENRVKGLLVEECNKQNEKYHGMLNKEE